MTRAEREAAIDEAVRHWCFAPLIREMNEYAPPRMTLKTWSIYFQHDISNIREEFQRIAARESSHFVSPQNERPIDA